MKKILSFCALALCLSYSAPANAAAACSGLPLTADTCCPTIGETKMADGKDKIFACLSPISNPAATTGKWKETSGGSSGGSAGALHWSGGWTSNAFWCDSGYILKGFHYDCHCSNNATWYACQK